MLEVAIGQQMWKLSFLPGRLGLLVPSQFGGMLEICEWPALT